MTTWNTKTYFSHIKSTSTYIFVDISVRFRFQLNFVSRRIFWQYGFKIFFGVCVTYILKTHKRIFGYNDFHKSFLKREDHMC